MSPNLPKTYKAAQISKAGGDWEIVDKELQQPAKGEILVKVLASGVCHSDSIVKEGHMPIPYPLTPGHEIIGDCVALGEGEKRFKVGDRVGGGWHGGHDGICKSCIAGDFVTCKNEKINGVTMNGGHQEYVLLRTEAVAAIPTDIDPVEAAPLLCAGLTVFNSLRHMDLHPGDVVAVQGIGGLGHLALQYSRNMGYRTVALSTSASKKDLAQELGAHVYVDGSKENQAEALQKLGGAKVILCTAPNSKAISGLVPGLGVDGQILIIAAAPDPIEVPALPMIMKRLSIRGWPSGTASDSEDTIAFSQLAGVKCRTETYKLEEISKAYDSMMKNEARFRAVIKF